MMRRKETKCLYKSKVPMLCFTKMVGSDVIKAVYTGRFCFFPKKVFLSDLDITESKLNAMYKILKKKDISADSTNMIINFYDAEIFSSAKEEFVHANWVSKDILFLALLGLRWFVRLLWFAFNARKLVEKYYELRTLYYLIMYDVHEELAQKELQSFVALAIIYRNYPGYFKKVIDLNTSVRDWLIFFVFLLFFPVEIVIGYLMVNTLTMVLCLEDRGKLRYIFIEPRLRLHVLNDDFRVRRSLLAKFYTLIQIESFLENFLKLGREKLEQDLNWFCLKLKAEKRVYRNFPNLDLDDLENFYKKIFMFLCDFIEEYDGFKRMKIISFLIQVVRSDSCFDLMKLLETLDKENFEKFRIFVNFFYMHGN